METGCKDDLKLAARVVQGDVGAFNDFYSRHTELVFAFICHLLDGTRADAEEIWQDTFVAALRALPGYRGQSRLSSWLCSIARNKVADFCRRQGRGGGPASTLPPGQLLDLMDSGPLADEVMRQGALRAQIVEALAGLPADYRNALLARYVEGRTVEEIARLQGRSYKAMESILSRSREALRDQLKGLIQESL
jgi:RNA polymerase sigma-70 factor (ECF subfamily)